MDELRRVAIAHLDVDDGPPEDAGDDSDLDVDVVDEAAGQGDAARAAAAPVAAADASATPLSY